MPLDKERRLGHDANAMAEILRALGFTEIRIIEGATVMIGLLARKVFGAARAAEELRVVVRSLENCIATLQREKVN